MTTQTIGGRLIGPGHSTYVIGEIGINHNGDLDIAKQMIDVAAEVGCDAVKFQKRTPLLCVPEDQRDIERDTPWGRMTYLDYRYRIEFGHEQYQAIANHCAALGIHWFASAWDEGAVEFLEAFDPVAYKVASASITDMSLLGTLRDIGRTIILSTGMSTMDEIDAAVRFLGTNSLCLMHATSAYPCKPEELNLKMIHTLQNTYPGVPVGYSGHETGLQTSVAAVAIGACMLERHITLDRSMWGTDQSASVEPGGLRRLVRDVRIIEMAMGTGVKEVYDSELPSRAKLRRS
jgi:N-acetylneuraminate synthase